MGPLFSRVQGIETFLFQIVEACFRPSRQPLPALGWPVSLSRGPSTSTPSIALAGRSSAGGKEGPNSGETIEAQCQIIT